MLLVILIYVSEHIIIIDVLKLSYSRDVVGVVPNYLMEPLVCLYDEATNESRYFASMIGAGAVSAGVGSVER